MALTDDELRDVLTRAEEIRLATRRGGELTAEIEAVIGAAEEMGLPRHAVERALRERLDLSASPPAVGDLVFAQSVDGKFYVAEVVSDSVDGVGVRFLRGSEHVVAPDQVRTCSLVPGERVTCNWPWWGPWTCTVVSYDAAEQQVKLADGWGDTKTFPLSDVWLNPPRTANSMGASRKRVYLTLLGAGAGIGAVLGSILTALLLG